MGWKDSGVYFSKEAVIDFSQNRVEIKLFDNNRDTIGVLDKLPSHFSHFRIFIPVYTTANIK